ncbi:MAG: hypothetical protein Q9217_003057 [Psora testacea]
MFVRRNHHNDSFSKHRAGKSSVSKSRTQRSFKEHAAAASKRMEKQSKTSKPDAPASPSNLTSPIITLSIGPTARLFAAHENILTTSPYFAACTRTQYLETQSKRISLPEEVPEVFSSVLEFLYKGDYYPKLLPNKRINAWELEDTASQTPAATVFLEAAQQDILKDTLVYCAADRYSLPELKRLALRKQGLQSGISCQTILSSARYAYANTPDSDSKLRAHYLALIIRSRATFKRSGTMQAEMERGGGLFFDLFVAMCNHMDDISTIAKSPRTPRTL